MTGETLQVAVVGHTNTGKTSLLRTLLRDTSFGDVSDRPAVTRHVEGAELLVDGQPVMALYDTPGLEDSISLRERIDALEASGDTRQDSRRFADDVALIEAFLASSDATGRFAQEAKSLRQVMQVDVALYVIDARQRVLGKHRDELATLARCGRPVVPVLNFIASDDALTSQWRQQLSRLGLHAVAEFDTVVFDALGEQRLFEKMRTLLDAHGDALDTLIEDRHRQRAELIDASAHLIAELLVDAAAAVRVVSVTDDEPAKQDIAALRSAVRSAEQQCVDDLLALHRFRPEDCDPEELPLDQGQWGADLFSPEAMRQMGWRTGSAAAAGAMAGLTLDIMLGGLSLGAATGLGAAAGGLLGIGRTHGRRLIERMRGRRELRCDDATLMLLMKRQLTLVQALLTRGHASMTRMQIGHAADASLPSESNNQRAAPPRLPAQLRKARLHPAWSHLNSAATRDASDTSRHDVGDAATRPPPSGTGWGLTASHRRETVDTLVTTVADDIRRAHPLAESNR